jgi:3-oxoacyl-(acyl-carrier-protein) synthase
LGEVLGVGAASAAVPLNAWPGTPEPLVRTMQLALDDADVRPGDVGVVYASANAARGLDAVEASALTELFGGSDTTVTAIKGAIGESGASGAAACVAAVACGRLGAVPPIACLEDGDPSAARLQLARTRIDGAPEIVLVNAVASGGALFSAVLRVPRE